MSASPRPSRRESRSPAPHRGLPPWVARVLAVTLLLQSGSPSFAAACQRAASAAEHPCGYCAPEAARPAAASCHSGPTCHAPRSAEREAPPAPGPCCLLSADVACGLAAQPEVALRAPEASPLAALASESAMSAIAVSEPGVFRFPPGSAGTACGPPASVLVRILRL